MGKKGSKKRFFLEKKCFLSYLFYKNLLFKEKTIPRESKTRNDLLLLDLFLNQQK